MNVVDTAKEQVKHLVEVVTDKVAEATTTESRVQAITISPPTGRRRPPVPRRRTPRRGRR